MRIPKGVTHIIGIDEAGRGPLAGPVAVGVFCVASEFARKGFSRFSKGVRDSKKLSEKQREEWYSKILEASESGNVSFFVSFSSASAIDQKGIVPAIRRAIRLSLKTFSCDPQTSFVFLDGGLAAPLEFPMQKTIIRGDDLLPIISLASICAKVSRDALMKRLGNKYPEYGFESHKGYGTKAHYAAIKKFGPIKGVHRRSFLPSKDEF